MKEELTRDEILTALSRLDEILRAEEITGEVCIYGGAAMVLAFDARESTRDVDGVFVPKSKLYEAAHLVAEEMGFREDWLNDGVKGFLSAKGETTIEGMPVFDNLRVLRPTTEYLLAMKCMASRVGDYDSAGDRKDIELLLRELELKDAGKVCDLVSAYFPDGLVSAKVRFFIEEIVSELES